MDREYREFRKGAESIHFRIEDFSLDDTESQCQLSWWSSPFDRMQMWRSVRPGAGKLLI